ncbi:hypothetical protein MTR_6g016255 [Medicago truncatula]|uniref:Uncharacterized protein n=1 Tax=Medicago truncatula TaxID=3880 RepID=A0A072U682_MEDTR|nr:hypothetical protein MTR_6g016255 [Medicago truncatula]
MAMSHMRHVRFPLAYVDFSHNIECRMATSNLDFSQFSEYTTRQKHRRKEEHKSK